MALVNLIGTPPFVLILLYVVIILNSMEKLYYFLVSLICHRLKYFLSFYITYAVILIHM